MGEVGGSRHYRVNTDEGVWACPSCGADNAGPIAQGCASCGAGKPGFRPTAPPPPPQPQPAGAGDTLFAQWLHMHPDATVEQAFTAGYVEGVRASRRAQIEGVKRTQGSVDRFAPEHRMNRTLLAALTLFRDQVLVDAVEEIEAGEWCSPDEVNHLIAKLRAAMAQEAARV